MATKITDFATTAKLGQSYGPDRTTLAEVTGDAVDLIDADGPAFAILSVGDDGGEASVTATFESSANGTSGWTAIEDVTIPAQSGAGVNAVTFQRTNRYVRAIIAISDIEDSISLSATIGQGKKTI